MGPAEKIRSVLDRKLRDVRETPASFTFFVSLHDFVQYVESTPSFDIFFDGEKKGNRASEISPKYSVLKRVYQGIEDIDVRTSNDLGHDRYATIRELSLIRNKDVSDNNSLWKRRELLRKTVGEIHKTLHSYLSESDVKN